MTAATKAREAKFKVEFALMLLAVQRDEESTECFNQALNLLGEIITEKGEANAPA